MSLLSTLTRLILAVCLVFSSGIATAGDVAPLPPHFTNAADHPEDEFYRPIPNIRGIYAHGFSGTGWSQEYDGAFCAGSDKEQNEAYQSLGLQGRSEFWFYGSTSQGVLFIRNASFDPKAPCGKSVSFGYEVERAYVADGFIHSIFVDDNNSIEPGASAPTSHSAGQYSGSFERIHSLMARPMPRKRDRNQGTDQIAGVKVSCSGSSGLVWSSVCVARSGPAKGMILRAISGDDERINFSNEILDIEANKILPGLVFEIDRTWTGKD